VALARPAVAALPPGGEVKGLLLGIPWRLGPQQHLQLGPRSLAEEGLGQAPLGGVVALGIEGEGLGVLVVVGVQQQPAPGGISPSDTGVVFPKRAEAVHKLLEAGQGLLPIRLGHQGPPGEPQEEAGTSVPQKIAKPRWRGKPKSLALYY
jgi:hypothetical protein